MSARTTVRDAPYATRRLSTPNKRDSPQHISLLWMSGFVAKIFLGEGEEVPTSWVCAFLGIAVERLVGVLTPLALPTAQPIMVTVYEEENIAAFAVSFVNFLLSYFVRLAVQS